MPTKRFGIMGDRGRGQRGRERERSWNGLLMVFMLGIGLKPSQLRMKSKVLLKYEAGVKEGKSPIAETLSSYILVNRVLCIA